MSAVPATTPQAAWRVEVNTYDPVPRTEPATTDHKAGDDITAGPRSVVMLKNPRSG